MKDLKVFLLATFLFLSSLFLPGPFMTGRSGDRITFFNPVLCQFLPWIVVLLLLVCLLFILYKMIKTKSLTNILIWSILGVFIGMISLSAQGLKLMWSMAWYQKEEIKSPNGEIYGLLGFSFFQGKGVYLCQIIEDNWIKRSWRILDHDNHDLEVMVRPQNFSKEGLFIYNGGLFYFTGPRHCKLYYDLARSDEYAQRLNPFILIGPEDVLNEEDVKQIEFNMTYPKGRDQGPIDPSIVSLGLKHLNPRVRELSRSLLILIDKSSGFEIYPK